MTLALRLQGRMDRDKLKRWLNRGWTVCPACGSLFPGASRLCACCEDRVCALATGRVREVNGLTVRSLFDWHPGASDRLSRLLVSLKGPRQREAWDYWAGQFLRVHAANVPALDRFCVAGPARARARKVDHSFFWAQALAADFKMGFVGQPFAKEGSLRKLGWQERWGRERLSQRSELSLDPTARWIFADDILTTGSTARAVHQALGYPEQFEVWVLASRTRRDHDL